MSSPVTSTHHAPQSPAALPYRLVGMVALFLSVTILVAFLQNIFVETAFPAMADPALADKDFANYWVAAHLAADGKVADVFGPQSRYFAHMLTAMGPELPSHNWSYPPHYLLLMMPLALVGYKMGMVLFLAATGTVFFTGLTAFMGRRDTLALLAVSPFVVLNAWVVQNGFLTSGLILWFLALRDKRPVLAGICLGLMTIKPQLGLLLLALPLIERRWLLLLSAALSMLALMIASILAFGIAAWVGFVHDILPYQGHVMTHLEGTFLTMVPSLYAGARMLGCDGPASLLIHMAIAVPVFILTLICIVMRPLRRVPDMILPTAIFLVIPYTLNYDLGVLGAAIALFIRQEEGAGRVIALPQQLILALAMLLPLVMLVVGKSGVNIAPVVLLSVLALMMRRAFIPTTR